MEKEGKVIKIEEENIVITTDGETVRAKREWFNFDPQIGDLLTIYPDGEELIIHKQKKEQRSANSDRNWQGDRYWLNESQGKVVNKWTYFFLALFFGGFGAHKFYSGYTEKGIVYLLFSWTLIPMIFAFCTCVATLMKPTDQSGNITVTS